MRAMRHATTAAGLLASIALLPGCGSEPEPAPAPAAAAVADPNDKAPDKPDELRHYINEPIDKAKSSNDQQIEDAKAQAKAIEEAGG